MANYLLLRNNKESGPYSTDDLMQMGLKAYDLVWVQGKSAAWRYPSEVEELKPFAPAVEEQPFDRFYKKPSQETKTMVLTQEKQEKQEIQAIAPEHEKYIPKKSVFVTMPGQRVTADKPVIKEEKQVSREEKYIEPSVPVQQTISVTENPAASQVKFSQPLDEIKEMYVKTLHERKQKIARKSFLFQSLKKVAVILLLIAVGVVAGLIIQSKGNKNAEIVKEERTGQQGSIIEPSTSLPSLTGNDQQSVQETLPTAKNEDNIPGAAKEPVLSKQPVLKNDPVNDIKREALLQQPDHSKDKVINTETVSAGVNIDPATGERSRKVRDENSTNSTNSTSPGVRRSFSSSGISELVSVTSNDYKIVAFGGIRNLELTVNNDSKYTLDNVLVELQYIKPNELPLKTENVEFKTVGPKSAATVRIPDTNRGIKVVYRIINIRSRQMDEVAAGN
jgi:hypothetical protein